MSDERLRAKIEIATIVLDYREWGDTDFGKKPKPCQ